MSMLSNPIRIFAIFVLLFGAIQAAVAEPVGRMHFVSGSVHIERGSGQIPATKDMLIEVGDVIVTQEASRAQWRLQDDSYFALRSNSRFEITDYRYAEDKSQQKENKSILTLLRGGVRTLTGLIAKNNQPSYQVKHAVATMGVRGTDYIPIFVDETLAAELGVSAGLYVRANNGGAVVVSNSAGSLEIGPGQVAFVANGSTAPVLLDPISPVIQALFNDPDFEFQLEFFQDLDIDLRIEGDISLPPQPPASPN